MPHRRKINYCTLYCTAVFMLREKGVEDHRAGWQAPVGGDGTTKYVTLQMLKGDEGACTAYRKEYASEGDAEALRNNAENDRTTRSVRRLHVNAVKCLLRRVALSVYTFSPQDLPEGPLAVKDAKGNPDFFSLSCTMCRG